MRSEAVLQLLLMVLAPALWTPMFGAEALDAFGFHWTVPVLSDWSLEESDGVPVLRLSQSRGPLPGPRRPIQFALAATSDFQRVKITADGQPLAKSLIIVFGYRDEAHFDYAHLSTDTAAKEPVHNGVFHVYGGERVRISSEEGPAAFPASNHWYHVELAFDGASGTITVLVDGKGIPALRAVDLSLHRGRIGLGSFDETARFKNVKIQGS